MCGGTFPPAGLSRRVRGLSPRVRGNRARASRSSSVRGSIPACAGEPRPCLSAPFPGRVYPRVCGGTHRQTSGPSLYSGLSPRVRGNPIDLADGTAGKGSIPACAGEPISSAASVLLDRVYPRVCGGTGAAATSMTPDRGLSPRVRGNPQHFDARPQTLGSIPACAGEPNRAIRSFSLLRVYPRVCGGTSLPRSTSAPPAGLSPRVRGNQHICLRCRYLLRSIPACAGEPCGCKSLPGSQTVYPRVCGGTGLGAGGKPEPGGLSPRVRGNLAGRLPGCRPGGSIPACAGEPALPLQFGQQDKVYPRVCGGTATTPVIEIEWVGLSPRVRGNRVIGSLGDQPQGSIPACAGEPKLVHPRTDCR